MTTIPESMNSKNKIDLKAASPIVFDHFLGQFYPGGRVVLGRNISNPFLQTRQQTPSFNIYRASDGNLVYNDFATDDKGNCVSFVAKLKGITRIEAIRIIRKISNQK